MTGTNSSGHALVTAAVLVIGDEILSGRTKDKNIGYIADYLTALGIDLKEVRVVGDIEGEIVAAVNALRARYTYVFTTGGIGPTHDDITAECVAKAFGVTIDYDPRAVEILRQCHRDGGRALDHAGDARRGGAQAQNRSSHVVGNGAGRLPRGRHRHSARRDRQGQSGGLDRQLSVL